MSVKTKNRHHARFPVLLTGTAVLFSGTLLAHIGNYLFTFIMARLLSPADYGDMVAIFALGTLLAVPTSGIVNVISRDVSDLKGRGQLRLVRDYLTGTGRLAVAAGIGLAVSFAIVAPIVAQVLNLSLTAVVAYSMILVFTFLIALGQGTIQGLQRFSVFSFLMTGITALKLLLGVGLVLAGYQLMGAIWSVVITQALFCGFIALYVYKTIGLSSTPKRWPLLKRENQLVIAATLLLLLLINLDLFFAKHYFPADLAGSYAVLSVLGKIIIFATSSVAMVLLPVASERVVKKQPHRHLAVSGLALVYLPGFFVVSVYAFFPAFVVNTLFPGYAYVVPYLGLYGGFSLVLAVLSVLIHYFMAIRDYRFVWLLGGATLTAVVLMFLYHQSFFRLIAAGLVAALAAVAGSLILLKTSAKSRFYSV